ncbi:histone-lysine N-methyltransferase SETMAR [Trichonephila clavipes]|nr:histone-lysine N-methyltransferase SETMAR [Trichonephila clavipes]
MYQPVTGVKKFNYKNALPAGRLIPIVSNYPNEIVTLDLLGPYPASRLERYRFILVITDLFTKWSELIPLRKALAQARAKALFENYISRYGAPIGLFGKKGKNAVQAGKKLTDVYGEGVLTVRQCQNWFAKFRSGDFDVEDAPHSGKPIEAEKDIS